MAQKQKSPKQPQDPYAQRGKSLASSVQRLRGWVGSDPSRVPELADALVELTAHRLLGHGYAAAAADAQDAVRLAAQLLTANGPIGPYTAVADAVRCLTAIVHVATIQVGLGRPEAAGRTVDSLQDMRQQLQGLEVEERLEPATAIWALVSTGRALLAAGEVAAANSHADASLARLAESGLLTDPDAAYLAMDVDVLVSDCRWAAGRTEESLTHLHLASNRYDQAVDGRLQDPARLSPGLVERLAQPLFALHRDLADRLAATGEVDLGLVTRRSLVESLERLSGRLGDAARTQLAMALADLAGDLLAADRVDEAEEAAARAAEVLGNRTPAGAPSLLVAAVRSRVLTRTGRGDEAVTLLRRVLLVEAGEAQSAARALVLGELVDALRAGRDADATEVAQGTFEEAAHALLGSVPPVPAARAAVQDLARGVVSRGAGTVDWSPLDAAASYAATTAAGAGTTAAAVAEPDVQETAAWLEAERSEARQHELERLEQARLEAERRERERAEAERAAAEQRAAEQARAEREAQLEEERREAAEEAERLATKRRREERLEAHRVEAERLEAERLEAERLAEQTATSEADELALAQQEWDDARARGDRRGARAANERVVELLRPRTQSDLARYGPQLRKALEDLSSARLRSGDVWGSRAPAREARALARALGD